MSNKSTKFLVFIFGAGIGSVITWIYAKKKYERIAREEIDSVKEILSNRENRNPLYTQNSDSVESITTTTVSGPLDKAAQAKEKPNIIEYTNTLKDNRYVDYSRSPVPVHDEDNDKEETENMIKKPYIIEPDSFGEFEDYDTISLIYYEDQVLANEDDECIDDVDDLVGYESLTHFGEYEDDSVFVRNDTLKCDYEILFDKRKYSDIIQGTSNHMED